MPAHKEIPAQTPDFYVFYCRMTSVYFTSNNLGKIAVSTGKTVAHYLDFCVCLEEAMKRVFSAGDSVYRVPRLKAPYPRETLPDPDAQASEGHGTGPAFGD